MVVGDWKEAERMLLVINKNPAAYLYYYLTQMSWMTEDLVKHMLKGIMDPALLWKVEDC